MCQAFYSGYFIDGNQLPFFSVISIKRLISEGRKGFSNSFPKYEKTKVCINSIFFLFDILITTSK